ncbi:hypothetical protein [Halobaculum limi]|uniref:hypothetical protein n=1 Tax=Halobaculum limi TaxID=3031916 RepID=UPI00240624CF|nr:hypothetical protein [Halobaculum sp. YSMS11]
MPSTTTRRRYCTSVVAAVVAASAGCTGTGPSSPATDDDTDTATERSAASMTDSSDDGTASTGPDGAGEGLDLREANVTAVAVGCDGLECRFDVTLYHDVPESEALVRQSERSAF